MFKAKDIILTHMTTNARSVLIIDDDEINNLICKRIIQEYDEGIEVRAVTSGAEALTLLQGAISNEPEELPDIILLDINMPIMNGWDFIHEFRKLDKKHTSDINLFILTSSKLYQDSMIAENYSEVKEMITKPLTINTLDRIKYSLV